ncbi:hypothetical protein K491DRAFT_764896 [Lophiostoma macrostomum CBS 122681]|uniref:Polynucleotide 5'-hydroxyl-kinase GRC3 n=1 Tax=Lophiostoma macrostomum CBS 122681 TaxID=1314788 RepID=A0A6A6TRQ2_9PLEO|nr:hypothetical protein K491DRAFT_764896 [Lophiostoma macrostomum CBS 122681]
MVGKRKRGQGRHDDLSSASKPLSAVAAAKLKSHVLNDKNISSDASLHPDSEFAESDEKECSSDVEFPVVRQNLQLCSWRYGPDYVSSETEDHLTVSLDKNATIALIGCFEFIVLRGAVNINGGNFAAARPSKKPPQTHRVFIPSTQPISSIKGLDSRNEVQFIECAEPTPFASLSPLYGKIWNANRRKGRPRSFALITESNDDTLKRPIIPETVPEDWVRQIEDASKSTAVTMVCGKPSSGKSIFARRLRNRYLTGLGKHAAALPSVYYLDLDASKSTYTPHGQISLVLVREAELAPPFLNASTLPSSLTSNEVIHSFPLPIGALSNYDDYFVACVGEFIGIYAQSSLRNPSIPLIIDTPGWLYSTRLDLLLRSISRVKPQRLVCLSASQMISEESSIQDALNYVARRERSSMHEIPAQSILTPHSRTEQELRSMQMLSYFHCDDFNKSKHLQHTSRANPLSSHTPWEFCYEETDEMDQSCLGFLLLNEWADADQIPAILNGSVVQIVHTEGEINEGLGSLARTEQHHIPYFEFDPDALLNFLNPSKAKLLCTALLRGWDFENRIAQLLIPKSHDFLVQDLDPKKTILVFGCCEYPEWAYTEDAYYALANTAPSRYAANGSIAPPSWVAPTATADQMGYLNVPRRVRKFQQ